MGTREELEHYRSRNRAGRKKHDEAWMDSYNDFVMKYEGGMSIMEIVSQARLAEERRIGIRRIMMKYKKELTKRTLE